MSCPVRQLCIKTDGLMGQLCAPPVLLLLKQQESWTQKDAWKIHKI